MKAGATCTPAGSTSAGTTAEGTTAGETTASDPEPGPTLLYSILPYPTLP